MRLGHAAIGAAAPESATTVSPAEPLVAMWSKSAPCDDDTDDTHHVAADEIMGEATNVNAEEGQKTVLTGRCGAYTISRPPAGLFRLEAVP